VSEIDTYLRERRRNGPQGFSLTTQLMDEADDPLLIGILDKFPLFRPPPAEGHGAAEIAVAAALVSFRIADAFSNPVSLSLCNSGQDCENQLADAIAGHVAPEIDHV